MDIVRFANSAAQAEQYMPPPEKCRAGNPVQQICNHYTDPTGLFFSGVWQGEVCTLNVQYAQHEEEFCVLLEGEVVITASDGIAHHLRAGDAFVVPGGFVGTWQNLTPVKKYYAIMHITDPEKMGLA
ncbi:MAG: cupin domain-containing protein [Burkholderiales bacterium]|nr:cupin domain-containing protein [Burkholderiales bacterium]